MTADSLRDYYDSQFGRGVNSPYAGERRETDAGDDIDRAMDSLRWRQVEADAQIGQREGN
jgi:hypothetical protein